MATITHCCARIGAAGRTGRKRSLMGKKRVIWTFIGANFATAFLRPDGGGDAEKSIELVVDHIEYMLEHVGEDGVGLGSSMAPRCRRGWATRPGHRTWSPDEGPRVRSAADREGALQELAVRAGPDLEGRKATAPWRAPLPGRG
jgi:hypothetical protein